MNVGEIIQACYFTLGEPMPPSLANPNAGGTWKIGEMLYWLNQSQNEHAQRALSVKDTVFTNSIRGQSTYAFPDDFGELCSIRYHDEYDGDRELDYLAKRVVRDWGYTGTEYGDPVCYYREQTDLGDGFGLFPVPYKDLVLDCAFEGACPHFTPYLDRSLSPPEYFQNEINLRLVAAEGLSVNGRDDLDPNCVYVSNVGIFLRREGTYYPGDLWMELQKYPLETGFIQVSGPFPAQEVNARGDWVLFDFTQNPIEITPEGSTFEMRLVADGDYTDANPNEYGGPGIMIGTQEGTVGGTRHQTRTKIVEEKYTVTVPEKYTVKVTETVNLPTSVILLIDASGSMRGTKIEAAKAGARQVVGELDPAQDRLGIITFADTARTVYDVNSPFVPADALNAINSIGASGNTQMARGLSLTKTEIRQATTQVKLVILLSDGEPTSDADWNALARDIHSDGTIISTVGVQIVSQTHSNRLRDIALNAGGTYYPVSDPNNIPEIFDRGLRVRTVTRDVEKERTRQVERTRTREVVEQVPIPIERAYMEMHRLRGDIEVEYYRNVCDPLTALEDKLNTPERYHHTHVKQVLEKAYMKGGHDLTLSSRFGGEAAGEMELARAQAYIPTIGPRSEIRRPSLLQPTIRHLGGGLHGRFRVRLGSLYR